MIDITDLRSTIVPKSDQLNSDDLITGPRTFTIAGADEGSAEQPANIHLVELPGRPWRPSKSMRRVLVFCWGKDTDPYACRRVTLYRDPEVTFGRDKVGGIKIEAMSHIDAPKSVSLTVTRGKRAAHTVKPLVVTAPPPQPAAMSLEDVAATTDTDTLRTAWQGSPPDVRAAIEARVAEIAALAQGDAAQTGGE